MGEDASKIRVNPGIAARLKSFMWTARGGSSGNGTFLLVGGHLGQRSSLAEWRANAPLA
jgi:hypothetical protein